MAKTKQELENELSEQRENRKALVELKKEKEEEKKKKEDERKELADKIEKNYGHIIHQTGQVGPEWDSFLRRQKEQEGMDKEIENLDKEIKEFDDEIRKCDKEIEKFAKRLEHATS